VIGGVETETVVHYESTPKSSVQLDDKTVASIYLGAQGTFNPIDPVPAGAHEPHAHLAPFTHSKLMISALSGEP